MTTYRVMAKGKHDKRFQFFGHHEDSRRADRNAEYLARSLWTGSVKVIVDDGANREELIYK